MLGNHLQFDINLDLLMCWGFFFLIYALQAKKEKDGPPVNHQLVKGRRDWHFAQGVMLSAVIIDKLKAEA